MKFIAGLLTAQCIAWTISLSGQVAINEIRSSNGHIELKNIGSTAMNVGTWYLCRFPDYRQLSTLTLVCGSDLNLEAGTMATVDLNFTVFADDDELGLYINTDFGNPASIRDYVEWGSHGHMRSSVAEAAGIWINGDFVPDWSDCASIEYDGSGDVSDNWEPQDAPTMPCEENALDGCGLMPLELISFEAHQAGDIACITWKAVHDPIITGINLQHSTDLASWEQMITWKPQGPEYDQGQYDHYLRHPGIHYYRLQVLNADGLIEYSDIRYLKMQHGENKIIVWPNPLRTTCHVVLHTQTPVPEAEYHIADTYGRTLQIERGPSGIELDLSDLPPGIYLLQVPTLRLVHRIVKF